MLNPALFRLNFRTHDTPSFLTRTPQFSYQIDASRLLSCNVYVSA